MSYSTMRKVSEWTHIYLWIHEYHHKKLNIEAAGHCDFRQLFAYSSATIFWCLFFVPSVPIGLKINRVTLPGVAGARAYVYLGT